MKSARAVIRPARGVRPTVAGGLRCPCPTAATASIATALLAVGALLPGVCNGAENGRIAYGYGDELRTIGADGGDQQIVPEAQIQDFPSYAPNGKTIVFAGEGSIESANADGTGTSNLLTTVPVGSLERAGPPAPSYSPDGKKIVFHGFDQASGSYGIYVMNANGTDKMLLEHQAGADDLYPSFSPDGREIVFSRYYISGTEGPAMIYVMNADGSDPHRLTFNADGASDYFPSFSPNGSKVVFERLLEGSASIAEVASDGSGLTQIGGAVDPGRDSFSPDGSKILFALHGHVCTMNGNGAGVRCIAQGVDPSWGPRVAAHRHGQGVPRRLVWADEFKGPANGRPDPVKWSFDTGGGGWGNKELQYYTSLPANARLDGEGHLVITARGETYTGPDRVTRPYTSARLQTYSNFSFRYGLMEARIKVPAGRGLLSAFWALADDAYGNRSPVQPGEIDAMEVIGSTPRVALGTLHGPWRWAPAGVGGEKRVPRSLSAGFHTYGVQWSPQRISFLLDGSVYRTVTRSDLRRGAAWPFDKPFFLLLDLAVGGSYPGRPSAATPFPASMVVDWVRVWQ